MYTLDNGGAPFRIDFNNREHIIKVSKETETNIYSPLLEITEYIDYIIGKDSDSGEETCLLINISKCKYMYIGDMIYTFNTKHKIDHLSADIGNSSVVYPICYDIYSRYAYQLISHKYTLLTDNDGDYNDVILRMYKNRDTVYPFYKKIIQKRLY